MNKTSIRKVTRDDAPRLAAMLWPKHSCVAIYLYRVTNAQLLPISSQRLSGGRRGAMTLHTLLLRTHTQSASFPFTQIQMIPPLARWDTGLALSIETVDTARTHSNSLHLLLRSAT